MGKSVLTTVIDETEERFSAIAPTGMLYDAEKGYVIQLLQANDYLKTVANKEPQSLQQAMTNVAAIGLSLSPAEHLAYLVPRKGKICLDVSYRGFCRLATNSGSIQWIQAELAYLGDDFKPAPMGEMPHHEFDPFLSIEERGEFRGGYCVAKTTEGDYLTTYLSAEKIYNIRGRSEAYKTYLDKHKTCTWVTDFEEMAKKSCVRNGSKMWPRTDQHQLERMAIAVQLSNEAEEFEPLKTSPNLAQFTEDQKGFFDQLIEASNGIGMAAFKDSIEEAVFINLYNSFEKGSIGKYKALVDQLCAAGIEQIHEYGNRMVEAVDHDDGLDIEQMLGELKEDELEMILRNLPDPVCAIVRETQSNPEGEDNETMAE